MIAGVCTSDSSSPETSDISQDSNQKLQECGNKQQCKKMHESITVLLGYILFYIEFEIVGNFI